MINKNGLLCLFFSLTIVVCIGCGSSESPPTNSQTSALLTISANPTTVADVSYSSITATLKNIAGTPIYGYHIDFDIIQEQSKSVLIRPQLTIVNDLTDIMGNASVIYKSGPSKGIDVIQASCINVNPISVAIYVTPKVSPTPSPSSSPKASLTTTSTSKSAPTPPPTSSK